MAKKVIPRDKTRVEHAAKQGKMPSKAKAAASRPAASRNRRPAHKAAPAQKSGIAGFIQRFFGRFKRQ
jgi:hypothetical protein